MTIPEILKELEPDTRRFPVEAMRSAIEQREVITPELLRVVEAIAANPVELAKREDYMLPVFALYLLAQFREKRAYPAVVEMFSAAVSAGLPWQPVAVRNAFARQKCGWTILVTRITNGAPPSDDTSCANPAETQEYT